ncbi:LacI family DNA-binding transcriptional regulator [Nocardioides sp. BP30]|uniref:LacI family DNA-binding transcriptional regulator n=1 Tax=Nocardioides sp. BP30 TaxID=3036374 RepID=UPI0024687A4F|nr:LacI family DNA-binding transcriptional regulator [Nocardioides sp. BP30]WGL51095.1 LacI family DNA-binding transcriptional regulator [Nocardioides sp. BP30]
MVTLRDVARAAGVSPATASRALGNPDVVAAGTRERVLRTARELGYRANQAARALATGDSGMIGLVVPDIESPFFASIAKGVDARARELGSSVLIADTQEDAELEAEVAGRVQERVEGVILCSPRMGTADLGGLADLGPTVLINRESSDLPSVSFETPTGVRAALAHLRSLGHRVIAYVGGPHSAWADAERRSALHAVPGLRIVDLGHHRPVHDSGAAAVDTVMACGASAVLCYNDLVAVGLVRSLQSRGIRVPEDISVVGFDDIALATLTAPALTTVRLPWAAAGRVAVDLLLGAGEDAGEDAGEPAAGRAPRRVRLGVELVVRESTGVGPERAVPPLPEA